MKKKFINTLIMMIAVVVLLSLFLKTLGIFDENYKTYPATIQKIKMVIDTKGYVFRDETLIGAVEDGEIEYLVEEGERVFVGQALAKLTPVKASLEDEEAKKEEPLDFGDFMIDVEGIRSNIRSLEDELSYLAKQNKYSEIEDVQQRLSSLYLLQSSFGDGNGLRKNAPVIKASKEGTKYIYYANTPGLIGLEQSHYDQLFHIRNMHLVDYSKLEQIGSSEFLRNVSKGDSFLRIIDNKESYIVVKLTEAELAMFEVGRLCTIEIGNVSFKAENYQAMRTEQQNGMIFRVFEDYPGMTSFREVDLKLIAEETEGIHILTKSIVDVDGQPGVYILKKNGKKEFVPIKIKGHIGEEAVIYSDYFTINRGDGINESIETVNLYDEIVEEP